jgi:hypothetical protein
MILQRSAATSGAIIGFITLSIILQWCIWLQTAMKAGELHWTELGRGQLGAFGLCLTQLDEQEHERERLMDAQMSTQPQPLPGPKM